MNKLFSFIITTIPVIFFSNAAKTPAMAIIPGVAQGATRELYPSGGRCITSAITLSFGCRPMFTIPENQLLSACQTLFGNEALIGREFLFYLQPSGARAAFRRKAKELHPDLAPAGIPRQRQSDRFRELVAAHELIGEFLRQRESGRQRFTAPLRPEAAWSTPPRPRSEKEQLWSGPVPQQQLFIGQYCYYRGLIPYPALIEAIAWQRRQRPCIGELARRWGWLGDDAIRSITRTTGVRGRFGDRAVQLGLLAPHQIDLLVNFQKSRQQRLGQYFVEQGYLSDNQMTRLVGELRDHNQRIATLHGVTRR